MQAKAEKINYKSFRDFVCKPQTAIPPHFTSTDFTLSSLNIISLQFYDTTDKQFVAKLCTIHSF